MLHGGELSSRIESRGGKLTEQEGKKYMFQMLCALNYLHMKKIVHRDLKPENFMFKEANDLDIRLIDFGLSTYCHKGQLLSSVAGSPYYISPEVIQKQYTSKCDVWSLGVIFFQFLTGELPFDVTDEPSDLTHSKKKNQQQLYKSF